MLNLPSAFATIANRVSAALGAPFWDGQVLGDEIPGHYDDTTSEWVPPIPAAPRPCRVQIDGATEYMKAQEGFADGEVQFIILAATLTGSLDTDCKVQVTDGPYQGEWLVSSLSRDPAAIGWAGKGKRA